MQEKLLEKINVLLVEDEVDNREMLDFALQRKGAHVLAVESAKEAREALADGKTQVLVSDLTLPHEDGYSLVQSLRENPTTRHLPAIALTGRAEDAARILALASGFQKHISKPVNLLDLVSAIASLASSGGELVPDSFETLPAESLKSLLAALAARKNLRTLFRLLNAKTAYRFTSLFRFAEGDKLVSVWTFDRENPLTDLTVPATVSGAYCGLLPEVGGPFTIESSLQDPRVTDHPAREAFQSYCGVPVTREDGSFFGSLCHYDKEPRKVPPEAVTLLEVTARLLRPGIIRLDADSMRPPTKTG